MGGEEPSLWWRCASSSALLLTIFRNFLFLTTCWMIVAARSCLSFSLRSTWRCIRPHRSMMLRSNACVSVRSVKIGDTGRLVRKTAVVVRSGTYAAAAGPT